MIHLRPLRQEDLARIDEIWRRHHSDSFGIPSRNNVVDERVIVDESHDIIGYGMVKLFAEGVVVLDKNLPLTTRAKGVIVGIEHALDVVKMSGLEQFHIFTNDPHFHEVLQRHWGFRTAPEAVLYREIV